MTNGIKGRLKGGNVRVCSFQTTFYRLGVWQFVYSGLTLNQDKATKPQTVQIVRQGEAMPYWFKVNPLYKPRLATFIVKWF